MARTHNIIDEAGETIGQAPGGTPREALENFNRDACEGEGRLYADELNRLRLSFAGDELKAVATITETDELDADDDQRYTPERIADYGDDTLNAHLEARQEQLERARRDGELAQTRYLNTGDDDDLINMANATREQHQMTRHIRALQLEVAGRENRQRQHEIALAVEDEAHAKEMSEAAGEWIERRLDHEGLPGFDLEDPSTRTTTETMWLHAYLAIETTRDGDGTPITELMVAERVAGSWMALYIHDENDNNS